MSIVVVRAIYWFSELITMALLIRAVLSWFAQNPYSSLGKAYQVMVRLTEPVVSPCRELLRRMNINTGMFDFSVLLAFFLVEIVARILVRLVVLIA